MAAHTFSSSGLPSGTNRAPSTWRRKNGQTSGFGERVASSSIGSAGRIITGSPAAPGVEPPCVRMAPPDAIVESSLSSHPSR